MRPVGRATAEGHHCQAPLALVVIECRGERISEIVTFLGCGDRFAEFGLPEVLET
ncbi:hypothetical protein GCM10010399_54490 [Dactylosporangium fulvum]